MSITENEKTEAKKLVALTRQGKLKTPSKEQKSLMEKYWVWRKTEPYDHKRIGRTVLVSELDLGGIVMTNEYGAKVNGSIRSAIRDQIASDVEYAKANKLKVLEFRGADKAEKAKTKAQKEADKAERAKAREKRKAEKAVEDKKKAEKKDLREAKKLAKLKEDHELYLKLTNKK